MKTSKCKMTAQDAKIHQKFAKKIFAALILMFDV